MCRGIPGECDHSQTGVESPYLWFSGAPKSQKAVGRVGGADGIFDKSGILIISSSKIRQKSFCARTASYIFESLENVNEKIWVTFIPGGKHK